MSLTKEKLRYNALLIPSVLSFVLSMVRSLALMLYVWEVPSVILSVAAFYHS
jgi:hypothetical protein